MWFILFSGAVPYYQLHVYKYCDNDKKSVVNNILSLSRLPERRVTSGGLNPDVCIYQAAAGQKATRPALFFLLDYRTHILTLVFYFRTASY